MDNAVEFWKHFDKQNKDTQLKYLQNTFGDTLFDITRNWEEINTEIQRLNEISEKKNKGKYQTPHMIITKEDLIDVHNGNDNNESDIINNLNDDQMQLIANKMEKLKIGDKVRGDMSGGKGKITNITQDWVKVRDVKGEIHLFDEDDLMLENPRKTESRKIDFKYKMNNIFNLNETERTRNTIHNNKSKYGNDENLYKIHKCRVCRKEYKPILANVMYFFMYCCPKCEKKNERKI